MFTSPRRDHDVFHVGIARQRVENSFENIGFDPVPETLEDGIPSAKMGRNISPWAVRARSPKPLSEIAGHRQPCDPVLISYPNN